MKFLVFLAGLIVALLFAMAALTALMLTFTLVKDAAESGGSMEAFEANIRHYFDHFESGSAVDSFVIRRVRHPFLMFFGMLALSWAAVLLLGYTLDRLNKRLHQPA